MFSTRAVLRTTRAVRVNAPAVRRNVRFASDTAKTGGYSGATTGALAGAGAASLVLFGFYQYSGIRPAVKTAQQAKSYMDSTTESLKAQFKQATPDDPNQVIQALRETANKYARWIPGGSEYVDKAFEDLELIRKQHGGEVDSIVREAYTELRDVSSKGMNMEMMGDVWAVLQKHLRRLSGLAASAGTEILNNHPQLKQQFGGSFDQLKQLGESMGPEAKKQVDETWKEVSEIMSSGFGMNTVSRIQKLVQEKTEQIKKLGDQAWSKGYEQVKPMLEKNPQIKKMVEENMDTLKSGNASQVMSMIQSAISGGSTQDLEKYINQAKDKAQEYSGGSLSSWLSMVPNGSNIMPMLQKYKQIAEDHGEEAQKLVSDTIKDLEQVLHKRSKEVEDLAQSAQRESKK